MIEYVPPLEAARVAYNHAWEAYRRCEYEFITLEVLDPGNTERLQQALTGAWADLQGQYERLVALELEAFLAGRFGRPAPAPVALPPRRPRYSQGELL